MEDISDSRWNFANGNFIAGRTNTRSESTLLLIQEQD